MRKILLIMAFTVAVNISFAQTKVGVDSVSSHMGEKVEICSKVYGVKSLEKVTFINLGAAYPNSPLTVVIFAEDLPNFKDTPDNLFGNQQVCVTGTLAEFKGKPQIVITKPEEIIVQ